jgi:hypothetical protein
MTATTDVGTDAEPNCFFLNFFSWLNFFFTSCSGFLVFLEPLIRVSSLAVFSVVGDGPDVLATYVAASRTNVRDAKKDMMATAVLRRDKRKYFDNLLHLPTEG